MGLGLIGQPIKRQHKFVVGALHTLVVTNGFVAA